MRFDGFSSAAVAAAVVLALPLAAHGAGPYFQLQTGVVSRSVVEESDRLEGFRFKGDASSTRLLARFGWAIADRADVYLQGGAADLRVKDFNDFDASFSGAYGGGVRIWLLPSGRRQPFGLFTEITALRFGTDDQVQIPQTVDPATGAVVCCFAREKIQWNEFALLLGGAGWIENVRASGGIRLSRLVGTDHVGFESGSGFDNARVDLKERHNFGVFGGLDIYLDRAETTALMVEAHLADENAFLVGIRVGL